MLKRKMDLKLNWGPYVTNYTPERSDCGADLGSEWFK